MIMNQSDSRKSLRVRSQRSRLPALRLSGFCQGKNDILTTMVANLGSTESEGVRQDDFSHGMILKREVDRLSRRYKEAKSSAVL